MSGRPEERDQGAVGGEALSDASAIPLREAGADDPFAGDALTVAPDGSGPIRRQCQRLPGWFGVAADLIYDVIIPSAPALYWLRTAKASAFEVLPFALVENVDMGRITEIHVAPT